MPDLRAPITADLQALATAPLRDASKALLDTLGDRSDKTVAFDNSDRQTFFHFLREHNRDGGFDLKKALFSEWQSADLLFQLTDEELSRESTLFKDREIKPGLLRSHLFVAIDLKGKGYARGQLTGLAKKRGRNSHLDIGGWRLRLSGCRGRCALSSRGPFTM